ncbi:hypothetical protein [Pseudoponticoccus marisrubri]|uniref:hypothetical protein n=1 Tax=Pseudoponticoccus marisrubri TaxID=1685382 RepID=UPI0012FD5E6E|nr:hypothetical protein [Pseudoponticoccus marisrubri]
MVAKPGYANAQACTDPVGERGKVAYNYSFDVFVGCTESGWQAFHDPGCPAGDACDPADAFSFTDQTGVATSTPIQSNIVQITGLSGPAAVSITGDGSPEFRTCSASDCSTEVETWGSADQEISNNQYLQLQLSSSASDSTLHSATVTINGVSDQWDVTTVSGGSCPGTEVGGHCWFLSADNESCNTTCSNAGGSYDTATRDYVGSDGTTSHCNFVLNALGAGGSSTNTTTGSAAGCVEISGIIRYRYSSPETTGAVNANNLRIACACSGF